MTNKKLKPVLCAATALSAAWTVPAMAQDSGEAPASANDIIVTAQRVEQRLQDVPISITVLNQSDITNNNISNMKDLAAFTPGLAVNNRNGADSTTFTIRGFYQDRGSFATVGVFFADVVAPRGSGASFGGDGAGPGALFDLQNVQVLKGPQGTLFGRNVTGGAILLVPQKPTDKLEGYVEGGLGNYDMLRGQAVVNIPLSDTFRVRAGIDHMQRDGYLKNIGNFGDGKYGNHGMADTDYWSGRVSVVGDLTPDLENYTILSVTHSKSNGVVPKITSAFPGTSNLAFFGNESAAQMAREDQHGFWTVSNRQPDSQSTIDTWQIINTVTWRASDSLTVKNILSYGEFRGKTNLDLFGNYALLPGVAYGSEVPGQVRGFAFTHNNGITGRVNAQSSFVGELQLQGHPGDGAFTWQAGAYVEMNDPLGFSGVQTASFTACRDILTFNCLPSSAAGGPTFPPGTGAGGISGGTGDFSLSETKFRDYALYAQASYDLTEQLKLTGGIRYTWDKMDTDLIASTSVFSLIPSNVTFRCRSVFSLPQTAGQTYNYNQMLNACRQSMSQDTEAPTWLIGLDYKPIEDVLLYAKWSRGYRQGGLAIFGPDPIQPFDKETVDTYEAGAKTSWRGAIPGSFNVSGYYNDFRNQQLQLGVACVPALPNFVGPCAGNSTIINAGTSEIWGFEADVSVMPLEGLKLDVAYAYISATLKDVTIPAVPPPYNSITPPLAKGCSGPQCDVIANSGPPNQVVASVAYTLPLPESYGRLTLGGSYLYQSKRRIVADGVPGSGAGIAPSSNVFNLNATWENVAQMPIDLGFFMTNVTNEHTILQINDNTLRGFISSTIGEPRMYGMRLRYTFDN